ncbi:tetratricopeptide repeat protein [Marinitoga piezophila KA3]|uniref:Tetratricopeptide repeat protein n=1 Tax=Marinitoga piezophila (strain DSM 14283 / JCM 11233 / KA3) TaxID=443254 RepID=H2J638_MARPK|nr:tetratricopeptide repeat protein [Marinitoga piezophila KA3]
MELQNKKEINYYISIANMALKESNVDFAIENYEMVLKDEPNNIIALHNLGVCYLMKNEYSKAADFFRKAINNGFNSEETNFYLMKALFESGKYEECIKIKVNEMYFMEMNMLLLRSYLKLKEFSKASEILNLLKLNGFSNQELNLIEQIIKIKK